MGQRAAEIARLRMQDGWDYGVQLPKIAPGSAREARALDAIDELRDAEIARLSDTPELRRKRSRRYWARHR